MAGVESGWGKKDDEGQEERDEDPIRDKTINV
jgi:hypothetical protein